MVFNVTTDFTNGTVADATEVNQNFEDVENEFNGVTTTENTLTHITPIGSVVSWLKTLTNTPALPTGWVECNGQTISDADSVYDGVTLPDLNGNNHFLRGSTSSGTTGGSNTHNHSSPFTMNTADTVRVSRDYPSYHGTKGSSSGYFKSLDTGPATNNSYPFMATSTEDNIPANYSVVWIIRIK